MSQHDESTGGDALLHRYHDGELTPAEHEAVAARVARDPAAAGKLAALDEIGALLRDACDGEARVAFDAWPGVRSGLARGPVPGLGARLRRRAALFTSTAVAAVAAAVVLLVLPSAGPIPGDEAVVDEIEVTGAHATILQLAGDSAAGPTTVVWLEEDEPQDQDEEGDDR